MKTMNESFILEFWSRIFNILSKISVFSIVRKVFSKNIINKYSFVEKWVLGNLIFGLISTLIVYYLPDKYLWVTYIIGIYGCLRVFEVIIYQINVMFFDPYRASKKGEVYKIKSPVRMVILLLHNYVEVMFWYTVMIIVLTRAGGQVIIGSWGEYLRSNIICVATFDSSGIDKIITDCNGEQLGKLPVFSGLIFLQIITGIIMTLISLARFMNLMPGIESIDDE